MRNVLGWRSLLLGVGMAILLLSLCGCKVGLLGSEPVGPTPKQAFLDNRVVYHPVKTVARVTAEVYRVANVTLKNDWESKKLKGDAALEKNYKVVRCNGTVSLMAVPDNNCSMYLKFEKSKWADTGFNVQMSKGGLLTSVNFGQVGKAGEMIASTAKFAAGALAVAGMATGQVYLAAPAFMAAAGAGNFLMSVKSDAILGKGDFLMDLRTLPLPAEKLTLTEYQRYFHQEEPERGKQWSEIAEMVKEREDYVSKLRIAQKNALTVTEEKAFKVAKEKVGLCEGWLKAINEKIASLMEDYRTSYQVFLTEKGLIGDVAKTETYERFFELNELPVSTDVACADLSKKMNSLSPAAQSFLEQTGVLVALCGAPLAVVTSQTVPVWGDEVSFSDLTRICYRPRASVVLNVYADIDLIKRDSIQAKGLKEKPGADVLRIELQPSPSGEEPIAADDNQSGAGTSPGGEEGSQTKSVTLAYIASKPETAAFPQTPLLCVTAEGSVFSSHNITLQFSDGALEQFASGSKASAAAVSKAGSDAVSGFLSSYTANVNSITAMQSNLLDLAKKSSDTSLTILQNRKAIIEARLAVAGAAEAKQLEMEKDLLAKMIEVIAKRNEYDQAVENLGAAASQ